ncbi:MAG: ParB/RepB/Spo0J family partition protein [bacterium]|nr:ParB/RepB/Spo0J family partition protein [bacterium]
MDENLRKQQSVFWIEVEKIKPNPMQPRYEFDGERLADLSESIRQYGVLQPLVVTRREIEGPSGISVEYELIAGERRLRASKLAGLSQVPVIIREKMDDKLKLELAIIENLQREDLNPIERARAFKKLIEAFSLKHHEVASKVGKSRVFVTNSLRLLNLPDEIQQGVRSGIISEGHMRPILMLADHKEEQFNLYREILVKKLNVRQSEAISRRIAFERARKQEGETLDSDTRAIEDKLAEALGTRVKIEKTGRKGRIHIDFFSEEELRSFLEKVAAGAETQPESQTEEIVEEIAESAPAIEENIFMGGEFGASPFEPSENRGESEKSGSDENPDSVPSESAQTEEDDDLVKNFTL